MKKLYGISLLIVLLSMLTFGCAPARKSSGYIPNTSKPAPAQIIGIDTAQQTTYYEPVSINYVSLPDMHAVAYISSTGIDGTYSPYNWTNLFSTDGVHYLKVITTKTSNNQSVFHIYPFDLNTQYPAPPTIKADDIVMNDGNMYTNSIEIDIVTAGDVTHSATLNTNPFTSGTTVAQNGTHQLVVISTKTSNNKSRTTTINFTVDTVIPLPGNSGIVTTSNVTSRSITVDWTKATDNLTSQTDLQYLLCYSNSDITTVAEAQSATAVGSYTSDINSLAATGLSDGYTYYLNVLVKDEAGNINIYSSVSDSTPDETPPMGYSSVISANAVNSTNSGNITLSFSDAEVGSTYYYEIEDGSGNIISGNGTIDDINDAIANIDITGLDDGELTVTTYLTDPAGNQGVPTTSNITKETVMPVAAGGGDTQVATSNVSDSSITITWIPASDNTSSPSNLEYIVYYSTSNDIGDVNSAITNGTAFGNWTTSINSVEVTGLADGVTYYFIVIVRDEAGNMVSYTYVSDSTLDGTPPLPGNSGYISVTPVTSGTTTLNWTKAVDNVSTTANLEYVVYYSESNNIGSLFNAENNGTTWNTYVKDIDTTVITGLNDMTIYYFNLVVRDEAGNKEAYSTQQTD